MYNTRTTGSGYESIAAEYLRDKGYIILHKNYRTRYSEIDLIAEDGGYLVFIEVKYRKSGKAGAPYEAVDWKKQERIRNAALFYLQENGYVVDNTNIRFDVISICDDSVMHIENAF